MVEIDRDFPKKWPYGILKTVQWLGSLVLLITLLSSPFAFGGTGFVLFCGSTMFLVGLLSWIAHLLSFQRRTFTVGQMAAFIPFAFLDFIYSALFFILFGISALICFVSIFLSIGYTASLFFAYLFATLFCLLVGATCGYIAILLYRATPNGLIINLRSVIIEGDKTTIFNPGGQPNVGNPSAGNYPQGNPV
ncbi:unnamed protein product [Dracunculus medinensis]|uniref:MARVEL domain-containing protein n=1 Tax=Dracunculus medinensis TaxID=318479 RepID=A0A0N4UNR0_DRAME|nr:unnamed protein product [Dracunculus medinensis]